MPSAPPLNRSQSGSPTLGTDFGWVSRLYRWHARQVPSARSKHSLVARPAIGSTSIEASAPAPITDPFDFNTARPQSASFDYYQYLIENGAPEGERSEKFQEIVWHLSAQGRTIKEIVALLEQHPNGIAKKYRGRLNTEVGRSYQKWQSARQAAAQGAGATVGRPWPQIQIKAGELPRVVHEAEDALILLGREIYQRGGLIVRPVRDPSIQDDQSWQLIPMTRPYLVETLCCAAQFSQFDRRAKKWTVVDAPDKVADSYLNRRGRWKLPTLTGIVNTPFLRRDGSVCETPGYDLASELLFKADQQSFPPIPQSPSKADAIAALEKLEQLIKSFPFVTAADRSVALLDRTHHSRSPLDGDGAATRLYLTYGRDRKEPAGRRGGNPGDRPNHAGDRAGALGRRIGEALRRRLAGRRYGDLVG